MDTALRFSIHVYDRGVIMTTDQALVRPDEVEKVNELRRLNADPMTVVIPADKAAMRLLFTDDR